MTIKKAKDFIKELHTKLEDEGIDIFAEENIKYLNGLFDVLGFALKNLVPDDELDINRNKCKVECPFYTAENRDICSKLSPDNNCYQCVITSYQLCKSSYNLIQKEVDKLKSENDRIPLLENELIKLKAKLYDKNNEVVVPKKPKGWL